MTTSRAEEGNGRKTLKLILGTWVDERSNTVLKTYNKDNTLGQTNNFRYTTENTAKKNRGVHILH